MQGHHMQSVNEPGTSLHGHRHRSGFIMVKHSVVSACTQCLWYSSAIMVSYGMHIHLVQDYEDQVRGTCDKDCQSVHE